MSSPAHDPHTAGRQALTLAAIGVVFGDIGTSPLYTIREVFGGHHPMDVTAPNVFGILSLIFWSLIVVVTLKYVILILRANNDGEGGIMAMLALVKRIRQPTRARAWRLTVLGLLGAALFYGDGMITPAISVMSAFEGLRVINPDFGGYVIPCSLVALVALFSVQQRGTQRVGALFGPVMAVWFLTLGGLGISNILAAPHIFAAFNPLHAIAFFAHNGFYGFLVLGAVVLAVTGAEALYADMGHFGAGPIRRAWFALVLPCLLLNYFGQGALILTNPAAVANPFYNQAPAWCVPFLTVLATIATLIASQAVITGTFSITQQAVQLGYLPRMEVRFTSATQKGQIYIPLVNWMLMLGVIGLVIGFQSTSHLAAAYGIAVTGSMIIDSLLGFAVVTSLWRWNRALAVAGLAAFISFELAYFLANTAKIFDGGWFPLVIGAAVFTVLATWKRGRKLLHRAIDNEGLSQEQIVAMLARETMPRVAGTAVFLTANATATPHALMHNLAHNRVLHERVAFLTVVTENQPTVPEAQRIELHDLGHGFLRIIAHYGFTDRPDIPAALALCAPHGHAFDMMETSFFLSRETIIKSDLPGMARWRKQLFVQLARNAESAMRFFNIPTNRVIELGSQIEL